MTKYLLPISILVASCSFLIPKVYVPEVEVTYYIQEVGPNSLMIKYPTGETESVPTRELHKLYGQRKLFYVLASDLNKLQATIESVCEVDRVKCDNLSKQINQLLGGGYEKTK